MLQRTHDHSQCSLPLLTLGPQTSGRLHRSSRSYHQGEVAAAVTTVSRLKLHVLPRCRLTIHRTLPANSQGSMQDPQQQAVPPTCRHHGVFMRSPISVPREGASPCISPDVKSHNLGALRHPPKLHLPFNPVLARSACSSQRRVHQVDPQSGCPVVSWDTVPASQLPALNSGRAHVSSHTTPKRRRLNSFASKKAECLGRTPERLPTRGQLAAWLSGPFTGVFSGISGQVLVRLVAQAPLHGPTPTRSRSDQGPTSLQSRGDIPSADTT